MRSRLLPLLIFAIGLLAGCKDSLPVSQPSSSTTQSLIFSYGPLTGLEPAPVVASMNADGSNLHTILSDRVIYNSPENGRMVTAGPVDSDAGTIEVSDLDGNNRRVVGTYDINNRIEGFSVVLSHDASQVAYALSSTDTEDTTRDIDTLFLVGTAGGARVVIDTGFAHESIPAFSPDGTYIAYFVGRSTGVATGMLRIRNIRTMSEPVDLLDAADITPDGSLSISWAPSGERLLCPMLMLSLPTIVEVTIASKAVRIMASGISPVYSPDGSKIAFIAQDLLGTSANVRVMDANGGNQRILTDTVNALIELYPSWSRDSRSIVCTAFNGEPDRTVGSCEMIDIVTGVITQRAAPSGSTVYRFFWK